MEDLVRKLTLICPRDCLNHDDMLQIFQKLTPPDCPFRPTKIWRRETKKRRNSCLWCVLYQTVDGRVQYLGKTQARQLRVQINKCRPIGGDIVDYEFYNNNGSSEQGWLVIWKNLACRHTPNFLKATIPVKGTLLM